MSLSDCSKCWDTPCTCGYEYKDWSQEKFDDFIKSITKGRAVYISIANLKYYHTQLESMMYEMIQAMTASDLSALDALEARIDTMESTVKELIPYASPTEREEIQELLEKIGEK